MNMPRDNSTLPAAATLASDLMTELHTLQARLDTLAGACGGLAQTIDQPENTDKGDCSLFYAAEMIFENLHRDVGDLIACAGQLQKWAERQEGGAA